MRRFAVLAPKSLQEAFSWATAYEANEVAFVGGGTTIVPSLIRGETNARAVVDLGHTSLSWIELRDDSVSIGAMTTYAELIASATIQAHAPLLWLAAMAITGGPQLRRLATVGGSICRANPASDMPAVLFASNALLIIAGPRGIREAHVSDFVRGAFRNGLAPYEVLREVRIPSQSDGVGYYKLKLGEGSWPIVTAATAFRSNDARGVSCTIAVGGVQEVPLIWSAVLGEHLSMDPAPIERLLEEFVRQQVTDPWSDALASGEYRLDVAHIVAARSFRQAVGGKT